MKVSPGLGNTAKGQVLNYEYQGYRSGCGGFRAREGACGDYGVQAEFGAVNLTWNFGLSSPESGRPGSKGILRLYREVPDPGLAHPDLLRYATQPDSDVEVLREPNWNDAIRQIRGSDGLLQVTMQAPRGYNLSHYPPDAVGGKADDGFYRTTGQPHASWTLRIGSEAAPDDAGIFEVRELAGGIAADAPEGVAHRYRWDESAGGWDLRKGNGLAGDKVRVEWNADRTQKRSIRERYDPTLERIDRRQSAGYEQLVPGEDTWFKTSDVVNPGTDEKVYRYTYQTDAAKVGYRQLIQVIDQYGGWIRYAYDDQDRVVTKWSGFLNQSPTDDLDKCRVTVYRYDTLAGSEDDGSQPRVARTEIYRLLGKELGRFYRVINGGSTWTYRAIEPGAAWNDSRNPSQLREVFTQGDYAGRQRKSVDALGRLTTYAYRAAEGRLTTTVREGVADAAGNSVVRGTETVRVTGEDGAVHSVARRDIETGIVFAETVYSDHDRLGRSRRIDHHDGSYETTSWGSCCGLESERRRDGTVVSYTKDALGRVIRQSTGQREETIKYDADDAPIEIRVQDRSDADKNHVSEYVLNLAGERIGVNVRHEIMERLPLPVGNTDALE